MDATRRFPPADGDPLHGALPAAVARAIANALPTGGRVAVALSGGRDSVALLDATLAAATPASSGVVALHVDHGLSPNASHWAQFCRALCAERGVVCDVASVVVGREARISVEAAARTARYAALSRLARQHGAAAVLLAHHADDQAETLLLQLLRGAGPRGLAAMPAARFDGIWWLRPWLDVSRSAVDDYVRARELRHVDDESNAQVRYRRNALRSAVVPALRRIAPAYPATLVRAAELQADAAALLDDLAALDARDAYDGATLDCALFATLDERRGANVLRWFLREHRLPAASRARLANALLQLQRNHADSQIALRHAGAVLGVHRGRLVVRHQPVEPYSRVWSGADEVLMPHGALRLSRGIGIGIAARHAASATVTIRSGSDGERLRLAGRAARRNVADLLREAGVAHWERHAIPRIYCGDTLAAVAAIGTDTAFAAAAGEPGLAWQWTPATAPT